MPLFAVSLLSECRIAGVVRSSSMHALAIHIVQAEDKTEACARVIELGAKRQHIYLNMDAEEVSWVFQGVVECQDLHDQDL